MQPPLDKALFTLSSASRRAMGLRIHCPDQPLKMEAIQNFNSSLEVDEVRNYQLWFPLWFPETLAHRGSFLVKTEPPYLLSGAGPREDIVENSSNLQ